ncbi:MFS transporter [Cystobacter fuscus]|uniref:MFS transporter n=1 Tax=Cystobacter fuscus TaxID=43 RepID=UPI002B312F79|nr:MFS transporter [Cystobacter fuscus]
MRSFTIIWFGQFLSIFGSALSRFALGVWVYERNHSVSEFALITFFGALPELLLLPFTGALADRMERRRILLFSDTADALRTLLIAVLFFSSSLQPWHVYASAMFSACFAAFQSPAFSAVVPQLVPREQLGRASGMMEVAQSVALVLGPGAAGLLMGSVGMGGVLLIDGVSFVLGVGSLLLVRIPALAREPEPGPRKSLGAEALVGWNFIRERTGLLVLLGFALMTNFLIGFFSVLMTPIALSFASPEGLGLVVSVSGAGMLLGGLFIAVWGGPKRRVPALIGFQCLAGAAMIAAVSRQSLALLSGAAFVFLFCFPLMRSCSQVMWQMKVPMAMQGRVFAIRKMLALCVAPLAYLLAGPLVALLERSLVEGGAAARLGGVLGMGPGQAPALLVMVLGLLVIVLSLLALLVPRLRHLEREVADEPGIQAAGTQG